MAEQHQIQINLPGLLRMLGENIYAEPDVAIREMIQNAHDSCIIRGTEDRSYRNPQIHVSIATAQALVLEQEERAKVELERDRLKRQLPDIQLTEYRSCFFAFDYKIEDNCRLLDYIQEYFMRKELGIKVMAPATAMDDLNIHSDTHRQLKQAHFGIAEISNNNLNVLYESGLLHGMGKPLILLQRSDSKDIVPFDIFSDYRCKYEVSRHEGDVQFVWLDKELDKAINTIKRMLPEFDALPHWDGKQ